MSRRSPLPASERPRRCLLMAHDASACRSIAGLSFQNERFYAAVLGEQAAIGPTNALKDAGLLSLSGMQQEQNARNAHSCLLGIRHVFWIARLRAQLCTDPEWTVAMGADDRMGSKEVTGT